jgi:hypothetical protein
MVRRVDPVGFRVRIQIQSSEQFFEIVGCNLRLSEDRAESPGSDAAMVRDDNASWRVKSVEDHVAAALAPKLKADPLERCTKLATGDVGRELPHLHRRLELDHLLASLLWGRLSGGRTVLQVDLDGLSNVGKHFLARIALANAAGESRSGRHVSAIGLLLQNDCITHRFDLSLRHGNPTRLRSSTSIILAQRLDG